MALPCRCDAQNRNCLRSGAPMVGRLWELCRGVNCSAALSEKYRELWDSSSPADGVAAEAEAEAKAATGGGGVPVYRHWEQPSGPGTELSRLLKRFGIEPTPTCACRAKAAEMDAWGPDECSKPERIAEVVAVMRAEAEARGLPFLDAAGRMLVRRAIRNARRAAAN